MRLGIISINFDQKTTQSSNCRLGLRPNNATRIDGKSWFEISSNRPSSVLLHLIFPLAATNSTPPAL